jgi:hypothetical protein
MGVIASRNCHYERRVLTQEICFLLYHEKADPSLSLVMTTSTEHGNSQKPEPVLFASKLKLET